jgi:serine O-acetyltransferase
MLDFLRCDIKRYRGHPDESLIITFFKALYSHPSFAGILWYRLSRAAWLRQRNPVFLICLMVMRALYPLVRIYSGLEIAPSVDVGPGLWIGHFGPTIIHPETKAGSNLTILHGTTIGFGTNGVPSFGDDVSIGAGATIIGGIRIGSHVIIGAGSVVTKDIPDNSKAIGIPAQVILMGDEH